jgi:hypothetical protein
MAEDIDSGARGRRISRRGRHGFGFSGGGLGDSTTGARASSINAEVEELDEDLQEHVPHTENTPTVIAGSPSEEFNPRARLEQVRRRSTQYEREYRLGLLHRLLMRRIPIDEIATQLGVSVSQVYRDREELQKKLREDADNLDIKELIGDSKGFYEESAAMAMRAASNTNVPMPIRLAAIRTGLAAKNDMHRFFQTAGVYDALRYRAGSNSGEQTDIRRLMETTERLLSGEDDFSNSIDSGDEENIEL